MADQVAVVVETIRGVTTIGAAAVSGLFVYLANRKSAQQARKGRTDSDPPPRAHGFDPAYLLVAILALALAFVSGWRWKPSPPSVGAKRVGADSTHASSPPADSSASPAPASRGPMPNGYESMLPGKVTYGELQHAFPQGRLFGRKEAAFRVRQPDARFSQVIFDFPVPKPTVNTRPDQVIFSCTGTAAEKLRDEVFGRLGKPSQVPFPETTVWSLGDLRITLRLQGQEAVYTIWLDHP